MNNFVIYTNPNKDKDFEVTERVKKYLTDKGAKCMRLYEYKELIDNSQVDRLRELENDVLMIVLGGDGTVLRAVRDSSFFNGPVIGINMGTLGFMTEIELSALEESMDKLLANEFKIEKRMLLSGKLPGGEEFLALNDVVLARCDGLHILSYDIFVNGQLLLNYHADGIIVSTPTGSTGYNLSAGGPIASPAAELIMLTPICPHSLNQRSIILSGQDIVSIQIPMSRDGENQEMEVSFDGSNKAAVSSGDTVVICKSDRVVNFAKLGKDSFLEILNKKMSDK